MLEKLLRLDLKLFFRINNQWQHPWLDAIIPWLREPFVWAPLYLFLGLFVTINYKWRGFWWIAFFLITFGLADQSSSHIKDWIGRVRPCRDPLLQHYVRVLVSYCPGSGSFTSNHAANHFALGTFCFLTFRHISKWYASLFFLWAFMISYAQVYVGVHYPLDVAGGAVLGIFIGLLSGGFFQRRIRLEDELTP
ncbi:phosphatase PAP2 family protein [Chitinophaga oryziterrae]|uniref:Phosphatase PAP2 family protein n=1 Tax=Chitinophaga oryziterrae TaxID=1031224 RepID=A0A6N8J8P3_9BACT|nr:phosphatase PAP2 family protein [Chitinophaga oryziterrae]MVT40888.1 phosphatase PAP2 family protein [Chitinophaga oryziterrae]